MANPIGPSANFNPVIAPVSNFVFIVANDNPVEAAPPQKTATAFAFVALSLAALILSHVANVCNLVATTAPNLAAFS